MAGSDWEEVRRLMSDFQRVQQGSSAQRLSERNCIEIVTSLIKLKLLDVVYTTDGKEYITPQQLLREISDEIIVNGGRVNIVDVAQALSVDLSHVETAVKDLIKSDSSLQFVLGQLINADYVVSLADEINEKLQEKGVVNISDMTINFDLPADFLMTVVDGNLGTRIHGQRDLNNPRVILTDWLIARHRAILRGSLNASTRPLSIQSLVKEHSLNERLTSVVVEELISLGEVAGILTGKGSKDKSTFIPHVYTAAQAAWIEAFLKSNSYIPYDAVKKLDISDPKYFLKNRYAGGDYLFLETCILPKSTLERVEGGIEDVAASGTWTEINSLFPAGVDDRDVAQVIENLITSKKLKDIRLVQETFVVAEKMIEESKKRFDEKIETNAEEEAKKQASSLMAAPTAGKKAKVDLDDDDADSTPSSRKDRKGKRQTAKKSTGKGKKDDDDDQAEISGTVPEFLSIAAIVVELQKSNEEAPFELLNAIAKAIQSHLVDAYRCVLNVKAQAIAASSAGDRKSTHKAIQEQISATVWLMRMFNKGIEHMPAESDKKALSKLLLRNIGAEVLNPLLLFLLEDFGLPVPEKTDLAPEARLKLIAKLPEPPKSAFEKCNTAAAGDNVDQFEDTLQSLLDSKSIGMPVRKADKKKETQICQEHRQQLLQGIRGAPDIATALRLAVLVIFLKKTGSPLDAPGKFVPQILTLIRADLSPEQAGVLERAKDMMQEGNQSPDDVREIISKLSDFA